MDKGLITRAAILDVAMRQTARSGLAGLTFGGVAAELRMSKGGLGAHFRSKEALHLGVLAATRARFDADVVHPALSRPHGREQVMVLFEHYLDWMESACVDTRVAQELAVLPESVAAAFRDRQELWQRAVVAAAGQVVEPSRCPGVALQFIGLALAYQQAVAVFGDTGSRAQIVKLFERVLEG